MINMYKNQIKKNTFRVNCVQYNVVYVKHGKNKTKAIFELHYQCKNLSMMNMSEQKTDHDQNQYKKKIKLGQLELLQMVPEPMLKNLGLCVPTQEKKFCCVKNLNKLFFEY